MDLRAADYFLAIAEIGSINRAAEKLFISEPALSQYLKRLENELGVTLVLRSQNNALTLTQAGACFRDYCVAATELWREAELDLARIKNQAEECLIVGCSLTYLQAWLPNSRTEAFLAATQAIDIVFDNAANLEKRLLNHELAMVLGAIDLKNPALNYEVAQSRELDLCVSRKHPLAKFSYLLPGNEGVRIALSEASAYPFILLEEGTVVRALCDEYFHTYGITPLTVQEGRRSADVRIKLITSNAVGFLSQMEPQQDLIVPIALNPPVYYQTGAAYRRGEKLPATLRKLIALHHQDVCSHFAALQGE